MTLVQINARRAIQATEYLNQVSPRYALLMSSPISPSSPDVRITWHEAGAGLTQHYEISISAPIPSILLPRQHAHQFIVDLLAQSISYQGSFIDLDAAQEMDRRTRAAWYTEQLEQNHALMINVDRPGLNGVGRVSMAIWCSLDGFAINDRTQPSSPILRGVSKDDAMNVINTHMLLGCSFDVVETTRH